ncbi:hypothetical protein [Rhizobacter fulvus]|jgi:hypothetical protein
MPAVMMGFDIADKKMLAGLKVGDKVLRDGQRQGDCYGGCTRSIAGRHGQPSLSGLIGRLLCLAR